MKIFTLLSRGIMPGMQFRPTTNNLYGIPVAENLDGKAVSMLLVSNSFAEQSQDHIIRNGTLLQDKGIDLLVAERDSDSTTDTLVQLAVGRNKAVVDYWLQTENGFANPLSLTSPDNLLCYGHSEFIKPNSTMVGFTEEGILKLKAGESIIVSTDDNVYELSWDGSQMRYKGIEHQTFAQVV